jgi:hypothetical protein
MKCSACGEGWPDAGEMFRSRETGAVYCVTCWGELRYWQGRARYWENRAVIAEEQWHHAADNVGTTTTGAVT